jgi:hypothetical protein
LSRVSAAHHSRGKIYEKRGDIEHARVEYKKVMALPAANRIAEWAQSNASARLKDLDMPKTADAPKKK